MPKRINRIEDFKQKNEDKKKASELLKMKQAEEARAYNLERAKREQEAKERDEYKTTHREELEEESDNNIIQQLNLDDLDINLIDKIHNDQIRSRLQHEYNLQVSGYRGFIDNLNKPTYDEKIANIGNELLHNAPRVGEVSNAFDINITPKQSEARNYYNQQYAELLEKYPELAEPLSGGSYHCSVCNKQMKGHQVKRHLMTKKHLEGAGLLSFIKSGVNKVKTLFDRRLSFNNTSKRTLEKYGNLPIINITLYKRPLHKMIDKILNLISLGKWNKTKEELDFDKLYHVGLIFNLEGNKKVLVEKIEEVTITDSLAGTAGDTQFLALPQPKKETLDTVIMKALQENGNERFFGYSGLGNGNTPRNNCQDFMKMVLQSVGSWSPAAEKFIYQDVSELEKRTPTYVKTIADTVTDLSNVASKLLGNGKFVIQRVNVSKEIPFTQAKKHANNILKTKRQYKEKVVGNHYHFRHIPKTQIKKGTFRTKRINGDISLVIGELK